MIKGKFNQIILRHLIVLLFFGVSINAYAKKIRIEWQPISGAIQYEINIYGDSKISLKKIIEKPKWDGDLPSGSYYYQIRGIDKIHRPGSWSEVKFLAVLPQPPKGQYPEGGGKFIFYSSKKPLKLKWESIPSVNEYTIEIKRDGKLYSKYRVKDTQFEVVGLPAGKYSWKVNAVLASPLRAPASIQSKKWETHNEDEENFKIEYAKLNAPLLISPLGDQSTPVDGQITLQWKEVEGAQAYELRFLKAHSGALDQVLWEELKKREPRVVIKPFFLVSGLNEGKYIWSVRALSDFVPDSKSLLAKAHLKERQIPLAAGPDSSAYFILDKNASYKGDLGYIAFSDLIAPFKYYVSSPSMGFWTTQGASAVSNVLRLSGEYWFLAQWGISMGIDSAFFKINSRDFSRHSVELLGKFRTKLNSSKFAWSFSPKIGLEIREYNELIPTNTFNSNINNFNSSSTPYDLYSLNLFLPGISAGFDIRKQFSDHLSLGIKLNYFMPIPVLLGPSSDAKLSPEASYRNWSIGAQGLYWLSSSLGIGLGAFIESRSVSYKIFGNQNADQIFMDGQYFFGSLVYRFWR